MIRLSLVSNAVQLEAARRLRRLEPQQGGSTARGVALLLWEPRRMQLELEDRRLWPWRLPVTPISMALLMGLGRLGLVAELQLAHLRGAGRALRSLATHAHRLTLLDDGLDQYRHRPKAVDPQAFAAGTTYWLFSDRPADRAAWCRRFACRELGPLYAAERGAVARAAGLQPAWRTLVLDAPGLERLATVPVALPRPWLVLAHPVAHKRCWPLPAAPVDGTAASVAGASPEGLLREFAGTIVVGESMTLLAAAQLKPPSSPLVVVLPETVDPGLWRLARRLAAQDSTVRLF